MRAVAKVGVAVIGFAALVLVAAAAAGAALGVFLGVLMWTAEAVAGSFGFAADRVSPWWALALLALLLATDALGSRSGRRGTARHDQRGGGTGRRGSP